MLRTHDADTLRASDAGSTVTLAGWVARRRDHGGVVFLDLRDASGYVQVVVREEEAHHLRNEYCVLVTGEVRRRPGQREPDLPTGEIEVATSLTVLSASAPLPFPIETDQAASDDVRYTYRYLDLRRQGRPRAMRVRSEISRIAREVMHRHGFAEVETPNLTRSTPEGARDFVVPVRLQPGKWYALPQSPQLFKQLLMIGGLERYYQIARCSGRGLPRRPAAGVHPARLRDELRRPRRRAGHRRGRRPGAVARARLLRGPGDPADDLPRGDGPLRLGQARPALRHRADRADRLLRRTPRSASSSRPYVGAVVMPGGGSQPRRAFDAWRTGRSRGARASRT